MKRIVMLFTFVACLGVMAMPVCAAEAVEKKAKKEKRAKPVLEELTIAGVIGKVEKKGKNDKVSVKYILTDTEGNRITLPKPRAPRKKGKAPGAAINLDEYLDVGVKVTGKGTKMEKKGKQIVRLKQIIRIEKGSGVTDIAVFPEAGK